MSRSSQFPVVERAHARSRVWPALGLLAVAYLYAFPFFDGMRSANEMPRLLQTMEFVDKGHFWLDQRISEMHSAFDISWGPDGHLYPNKAPGPSFVAMPIYLAAKALGAKSIGSLMWAFRVFAVSVPAILFLPFFYRLTARFSENENARRVALLAYALGSPALVYGVLFMSHQLAAVCAGGAFAAAVPLARGEARRPALTACLFGALAAASVMMDYQSVLAAALMGIYFLLAERRLRNLTCAALGAAPICVLLGAYHKVCFGSPFRTGYHFSIDQVTRKGFMGIVGPSAESFYSTTVIPSNGLLVLAPWVVHALIGAVSIAVTPRLRRRVGAEALLCFSVFVVYVLFLSSLDTYMARGGWCVGPRYLTVSLPFAAWLSVAGFAQTLDKPVLRALSLGTVVVGIAVFVCALLTYPHWPDELKNPLYEITFRLLSENRSVNSLGHLVGLPGALAAIPLGLLVLGLMVWAFGFRLSGRWPLALEGLAVGAAILAAYSRFPKSGPGADAAFDFVLNAWEPEPATRAPESAAPEPSGLPERRLP